MKKIILIMIIVSSLSFMNGCAKDEQPAKPDENQNIASQTTADVSNAQVTEVMNDAEMKKPKIPKPPIDETEKEVSSILEQINKNNSDTASE